VTAVMRVDQRLAAMAKPDLTPVDSIRLEKGDILILCAGFEDRAVTALNFAIKDGSREFSLILIEYLPLVAENRASEIKKICEMAKIRFHVIQYDRRDPGGIGNELVNHIGRRQERVFLDISAMSRLLIVQALVALGTRCVGFSNVSILYTMAESYPPYKEEVNNGIVRMSQDTLYTAMFLSSGVFEVSIVPELSSVAMLGRPIRLILFPSFNPDQLAALRTEIQPSYFAFIHGLPPLEENRWRPGNIRTLNRIEEISPRDEHYCSTLKYNETLELLLSIYNAYGAMERIIIAPTGSKMQTVAVGIFRAFMQDIQIIYPTPHIFPKPEEYTRGTRQLFQLTLNRFSQIRDFCEEGDSL
jgi:hypothetical protein